MKYINGEPPINVNQYVKSAKLAEVEVRYKSKHAKDARHKIRSPEDCAEYLRGIWNKDKLELVEEFIVVCLNAAHETIGWVKVSSGGFNMATVDPKVVYSIALQTACTSILLAHNHPSGSLEPSTADHQVTRRLVDSGSILGIKVLDHIIITKESFYSFREHSTYFE